MTPPTIPGKYAKITAIYIRQMSKPEIDACLAEADPDDAETVDALLDARNQAPDEAGEFQEVNIATD